MQIDNNFIDNYMEKKELLIESKRSNYFKIVLCLIIYLLTTFLLIKLDSIKYSTVKGIVSQIQVITSVYLVASVSKYGYYIAAIVSILLLILISRAVILGDVPSIPGLMTSITTLITISIIHIYYKRIINRVREINDQKQELVAIYEELATTKDELYEQNKQLRDNEKRLNHLAYFDVLTELPNRKMIINRIDFLINLSSTNEMKLAIVFIDLDNFKRVNDTMGHMAGDLLIQKVTLRLKSVINRDDMLGRLGGDEFALIIQRQLKDEEILKYVEEVKKAFNDKFILHSSEINITASFGISIYPEDGTTSDELLKSSDTAMYKVKENGKNGIQFFNREMKNKIFERIEFENRLVSSIDNNELYLVFQPQYNTVTQELRGFEVLLRWSSPDLGYISPMKIIPIAEETRFIIPLGTWILRTACLKYRELQRKYNINSILSVNISTVQFMDPDFTNMVRNILKETGVDPQYLEFEITETIFISSMEYVVDVLNELKSLGIRFALDDFGTGYSSLSYLQTLPIDTLKIDKIFIDSIKHSEEENNIIGPIISLVHKMNISVIAEGVETKMQFDYLKNQDCDCIQGYLFGKPLNNEQLHELLGNL